MENTFKVHNVTPIEPLPTPRLEMKSIKDLWNEMKDNTYSFDVKMQRSDTWDIKRKSKLIESLYENYPILNITVNKVKGQFRILDGQQRMLSVIKLFNNSYKITEDIPPMWGYDLNGNKIIVNVANKHYTEFTAEEKMILLTKTIKIEIYENLTEEQENEIILRLNSGIEMKGLTKQRVLDYNTIMPFVNKIISTEFFERKIGTLKQTKINNYSTEGNSRLLTTESLERVAYYLLALESGIRIVTDIEKLSNELKKCDLEKVTNEILSVLEYGSTVFEQRKSYCKVTNMMAIYKVFKEAKENNINNRELLEFLDRFFKNVPEEYNKKHSKLQDAYDLKIEVLLIYFRDKFGIAK